MNLKMVLTCMRNVESNNTFLMLTGKRTRAEVRVGKVNSSTTRGSDPPSPKSVGEGTGGEERRCVTQEQRCSAKNAETDERIEERPPRG